MLYSMYGNRFYFSNKAIFEEIKEYTKWKAKEEVTKKKNSLDSQTTQNMKMGIDMKVVFTKW